MLETAYAAHTGDPRDCIIVALDCVPGQAISLADKLAGHATWLKVGMTLFYKAGPAIIEEFHKRGFNIFLDLKLYDIPHQVEGAAASAASTGADLLSLHALGGPAMVQAAQAGIAALKQEKATETVAITILTSFDDETLKRVGIEKPLNAEVETLASLAIESGANGLVCSPQEVGKLRELLGTDPRIVTPGVRPAGTAAGDQSRIATPADALMAGASQLVIGRPITDAPDPVAAFEACLEEVEEALK